MKGPGGGPRAAHLLPQDARIASTNQPRAFIASLARTGTLDRCHTPNEARRASPSSAETVERQGQCPVVTRSKGPPCPGQGGALALEVPTPDRMALSPRGRAVRKV